MKAFEGLSRGDVLYTCLPLYHTAGGGLGVMICLLQGPERGLTRGFRQSARSGATMCLAKKFSAARFWREISQQQCTAFQYIGAGP